VKVPELVNVWIQYPPTSVIVPPVATQLGTLIGVLPSVV